MLIGLLIAAPIVALVVTLLASADRIFQSWLGEIPQWLAGKSLGESIARAGAAVVIALYTFCYLWGLLFPKAADDSDPFPDGLVVRKISFDPVIVGTLLVSVNLVYILFVAIQFSYLFGAANGLLPAGVAYAEYARRGFAELVLVALINLGLLLIGLHFVRSAEKGAETARKLLLSLLVGCTAVMLASAYSRLSLYEEAYGFTHLRLLVHGFMLFLGVLLAVSFIRIWREYFSLAKAYICIAAAAYVIMNYANFDYRIAVNNIEWFERTGKIDIAYLGSLSADAAPALLELQARHPELVSLNAVIERLRVEARRDDKWPSWNLSKQRLK